LVRRGDSARDNQFVNPLTNSPIRPIRLIRPPAFGAERKFCQQPQRRPVPERATLGWIDPGDTGHVAGAATAE
jgi:hypothetical protein